MIKNVIIETSVVVVVKESKIANHWSSAVPKKYKRNVVLRDLQRTYKISYNFEFEIEGIKKKHPRVSNYIPIIISFDLLLMPISKNENPYLLIDYLKKNIEKQFTLECLFAKGKF